MRPRSIARAQKLERSSIATSPCLRRILDKHRTGIPRTASPCVNSRRDTSCCREACRRPLPEGSKRSLRHALTEGSGPSGTSSTAWPSTTSTTPPRLSRSGRGKAPGRSTHVGPNGARPVALGVWPPGSFLGGASRRGRRGRRALDRPVLCQHHSPNPGMALW
jgi:hypothetical protein